MMSEFELVATGGTFDLIHKGHIALLKKTFSISSKVIIGLTSDELATKKGKTILNNYSKRLEILRYTIQENFPMSQYEISELNDDFGPAVLEGDVQALVVSEETRYQGENLNKLRKEKNLPAVEIVTVPIIFAVDGKKVSSTRIKNSEIDRNGNLL